LQVAAAALWVAALFLGVRDGAILSMALHGTG
jgi:hypothetical protein